MDHRLTQEDKASPCLAAASTPKKPEGKPVGSMTCDDFQTRLADLVSEASSTGAIAFRLPKAGAVSGQVLRHSINVFEGLLSKHYPVTFKFGFTHCPSWRWNNSIYGYKYSREKWASMVVLYASAEPYSPAMLEATLIEKYGSTPAACIIDLSD